VLLVVAAGGGGVKQRKEEGHLASLPPAEAHNSNNPENNPESDRFLA